MKKSLKTISEKKLFEMSVANSVICIVNGPRVCGFPTHNFVIFMLQVFGLFIYISNSPLSPVIRLGKGDYWASLSACLRKHMKVMSYLQVTAFIMQARSQDVSSHVIEIKRTAIYWESGKLGSLKMQDRCLQDGQHFVGKKKTINIHWRPLFLFVTAMQTYSSWLE